MAGLRLLPERIDAVSDGPLTVLGGVVAGARALVAGELAQRGAPILVIAQSPRDLEQLSAELTFFWPDLNHVTVPDYETLPYDQFSPHRELVAERLAALHALTIGAAQLVVVTPESILTRLPPVSYVGGRILGLKAGQRLDGHDLRRNLIDAGFTQVSQVMEPGELAVRGSLLDIFPIGEPFPVRIDLFDDEIESLRRFATDTQRSIETIDELTLLPAREFPTDQEAIRQFRRRFREAFSGNPNDSIIYREVSEGRFPSGIEYFLPLFFETTATLFDYLPADCSIVAVEDALGRCEQARNNIELRYEQLKGDRERPLLPPDDLFVSETTLAAGIAQAGGYQLAVHRSPQSSAINLPVDSNLSRITKSPSGLVLPKRTPEERLLWVTESPGRREVLQQRLRDLKAPAKTFNGFHEFLDATDPDGIVVAPLETGFGLAAAEPPVRIVAEFEAVEDRPRQRQKRRRQADPQAIIRDLGDLAFDSPVVHEDYGVGRYRGLTTLAVDDIEAEFLTLEYAAGDKLYVPVHNLHLISRYTGASPETAPLHRLGSDQWEKAKRKAAAKARDVAAELLNVYARRAARSGESLGFEPDTYERFRLGFPFEETEDQESAIGAVIEDLRSPQAMDRVICGDVGFGKTEVALRAAFVAVQAGKQVALLVPTTLLAQQHFQTFSDRFADWPINIALLSRFRRGKEAAETLAGISNGSVDVVIGTHRLIGKDVSFSSLGLVIIDEEHRFGVRHKEKLKALRANVDVLTLTATPIPRTLNMTLGGLRDLSLIATPPEQRLAVKTFVAEWNDALLSDAIRREMRRGGQVYFVHNRVEDIERIEREIGAIVPEAEIRIAHGQMPERQLESVMLDFYHRKFDVLLCTTIIESGIDVPSANTIIVNRADRFGLAQLHQLRGRVGRSHHQAYAYLVAPPKRALTADAAKRLEAIEALEDLGAGFTLATHDLEIRGAGELLGDEQSGQIQQIGFSLYNELLGRAVESLKKGEEPDLENPIADGTEINLGLAALIPADYMPDVHQRLVHYKRIATASSDEALRELQVELIDRFGLLPDPLKTLFEVARIKLRAEAVGITKVDANAAGGSIQFRRETTVSPESIVTLVAKSPASFRLDGPTKLRFNVASTLDERLATIERIIDQLAPPPESRVA